MSIEERHATISWKEDAEPPFLSKVHLFLVDTIEKQDGTGYYPVCGIGVLSCFSFCDDVDGPVTCKRCLRVKPRTLERIKKEMKESIRE